MKQFEYLNELKENLEGRLSPETIKDILSDYESFFVSGREEGKTDDEISAGLGSPAFLAKSLLEAQEETQVAPDKHIANSGRRLCAYFIDAVIAVLPAFVVTYVLGSAILSYMLLIGYPSPLVGASTYLSFAAYQEYTTTDTSSHAVVSVSEDGEKNIQKDSRRPTPVSIAFAVFALVFYMLYSLGATLILRGQTIGKRLMRIKVRRSDTDPVTRGRIFSRELLGKILINSIPIVPFISIFTILLTKEHKALHDMLADTIVVEV